MKQNQNIITQVKYLFHLDYIDTAEKIGRNFIVLCKK